MVTSIEGTPPFSLVLFEENKIIKEVQLKTMIFSSFLLGCE